MPNTPVRAAAEGMPEINRRRFIANAAVAATASVALADTAAAGTSRMSQLIEAHRAAYAAFEIQCAETEKAEIAYFEGIGARHQQTELYVPLSIGGAHSFHYGIGPWANESAEATIDQIKKRYDRASQSISPVERLDADAVSPLYAKLWKARKTDCRRVHNAVRAELKRRRVAGLEAAQHGYEASSTAETDALRAVCTYRCSTMDEITERARYLAEIAHPQNMQTEMFEALLLSMTGEPVS